MEGIKLQMNFTNIISVLVTRRSWNLDYIALHLVERLREIYVDDML